MIILFQFTGKQIMCSGAIESLILIDGKNLQKSSHVMSMCTPKITLNEKIFHKP